MELCKQNDFLKTKENGYSAKSLVPLMSNPIFDFTCVSAEFCHDVSEIKEQLTGYKNFQES